MTEIKDKKTFEGMKMSCAIEEGVNDSYCASAAATIKDSGDRTKYPSGAVRDRRVGKGMPSLVPSHPMLRIEQHFEKGRVKYSDAGNPMLGEENWKKGIYTITYFDSAKRHLEEWKRGDYSEDKLAAACWNILCLMETERRIQLGIYPQELDNRDPLEFDEPRDLYDDRPHTLKMIMGKLEKILLDIP